MSGLVLILNTEYSEGPTISNNVLAKSLPLCFFFFFFVFLFFFFFLLFFFFLIVEWHCKRFLDEKCLFLRNIEH